MSFKYASVSNSPVSSGTLLSPNDSHVVPISGTFCQHLSVWTQDGAYGYNTSPFLLNSNPKLGGNEYSSFSEAVVIGGNQYLYYFCYLYMGSSVTISACYPDDIGSGGIFYLIKGNVTFDNFKWPFDSSHSETWFQVDIRCSSGKRSNITYHISKSDFYFFLFYHRTNNRTNYGMPLNISISFNRTRYIFDRDSVTTQCTYYDVPGDVNKCSVDIPLAEHIGLVVLEPNRFNGGVNWVRDKAMLSTRCYPRVWLYFLTSFAVCVGIVLLLLIAILACIAGSRYHKKQVYHPALYEHVAPGESSSSSSDCQSENSNSPCVSLRSTRFSRSTTPK